MSSDADRLFGSWVERASAGEEPDFEALCRAHPEAEEELRRQYAEWRAVLDELQENVTLDMSGSAGSDGSADGVVDRLRKRVGEESRYEILGEFARGGMGAVLRVWDRDLRRTLAMKVVLGAGDAATGDTPDAPEIDERSLGRFLEEAQVSGQLDHPGIVPVHELGLDDEGRVFFTMKLVKGEDLRTVFERIRDPEDDEWSTTRALSVLLRVCEAMAYAHSKNVIHRDLKPANLMVGKYGEAYVMDWGLARVIGEDDRTDLRIRPADESLSRVHTDRREESSADSPLMTMDGDVVGTPAYMSPEQARGDIAAMGPASDVYSLGAILYQLLAGHMPYVPSDARLSARAIWALAQQGPPTPVGELAPRAPEELVAICEKAMARESANRYPDMGAMADDLRSFLEGRVVRAHRTGALVEFKKWVQRNKALAAAACTLLILIVGGSTGSSLVLADKNETIRRSQKEAEDRANDALAARDEANEARLLAETREKEAASARDAARAAQARSEKNERIAREESERARKAAYRASIRTAVLSFEAGDTDEAFWHLQRCPEEYVGWEWEHLDLKFDTSLAIVPGSESENRKVVFSKDGTRFASIGDAKGVRGEVFARAGVWMTGRLIGVGVPELRGSGMILNADGSSLFFAQEDGVVEVDVMSRKVRSTYAYEGMDDVRTWTCSGCDRKLPIAAMHCDECRWSTSRREGVALSDDGEILAALVRGRVHVWNTETGAALTTLPEHACIALTASPKGRILTGSLRSVWSWDASTGDLISQSSLHGAQVDGKESWSRPRIAFDDDGRLIATARDGGGVCAVRVWDHRDERLVSEFEVGSMSSIHFGPSGRMLVGSQKNDVWVRETVTGRLQSTLRGHRGSVQSVAVSPDGSRIVSGGFRDSVRLWDPTGFGPVVPVSSADSCRLSPDGTRLATWDRELYGHSLTREPLAATLRVLDAETGETLWSAPDRPSDVVFSPDGSRMVAIGPGPILKTWDSSTHELLHKRRVPSPEGKKIHGNQLVACSPDGLLMATCSRIEDELSVLHLWDARSGDLLATREDRGITRVEFSPDGRFVFCGVVDPFAMFKRERVFEVHREADTCSLREHSTDRVVGVRSPDETLCAVRGISDGAIHLWDTETDEEVGVLRGHAKRPIFIVFHPDGEQIYSGGESDDGIRIWDIESRELVTVLPLDAGYSGASFGPDGERLFCWGRSGVRVFETDEPLARVMWDGAQRRKRVESTLEGFFEERVEVAEVLEAVEENSTWSEAFKGELTREASWRFDVADIVSSASTYGVEMGTRRSLPVDLTGEYVRSPEENDWHRGTLIVTGPETVEWRNKAGRSWTLRLDLANGLLRAGEDDPYHDPASPRSTDMNLIYRRDSDGPLPEVEAFHLRNEEYRRVR